MGAKAQAVIADMNSDVNIPFVLTIDKKNNELDLIAKTVMRKKDFRTSKPVLRVENFKNFKEFNELLDTVDKLDKAKKPNNSK